MLKNKTVFNVLKQDPSGNRVFESAQARFLMARSALKILIKRRFNFIAYFSMHSSPFFQYSKQSASRPEYKRAFPILEEGEY